MPDNGDNHDGRISFLCPVGVIPYRREPVRRVPLGFVQSASVLVRYIGGVRASCHVGDV